VEAIHNSSPIEPSVSVGSELGLSIYVHVDKAKRLRDLSCTIILRPDLIPS